MSALKAIHVARRELGLDEDDYRAVLERVTGKSSAAAMTEAERRQVVDEFHRLGFAGSASRRRTLEGPYAKKLQALWISAWNLGLVQNRDDQALIAFVKRQTGVDHVRFLTVAEDAAKAVDGLKGWIAREGGVRWGASLGYDFLATDIGKVIWSQYRKLNPVAVLPDDAGKFRSEVIRIALGDAAYVGQPVSTLKPADWRAVSNHYGMRIRAAGKKKGE